MPQPQQNQPQIELHGTLGAPLSKGTKSAGFGSILLDAPHQGRTLAILDGEVIGWSKARTRLGKSELEEGDPIIIRGYRIGHESVVALEIG